MAAIGKQLKQSVNVFHNFTLNRLLPSDNQNKEIQLSANWKLQQTVWEERCINFQMLD